MLRLSRAQVRAVDRIAIEEYGIPGIVLMENAARSVVDAIVHRYGSPEGKQIAIVCGNGNNGGDGYAIARHLHNRGATIEIIVAEPERRLSPDAEFNAQIVHKMRLPVLNDFKTAQVEPWLTIDALFGTGLKAPPRDRGADVINRVNLWIRRIVAVDLPSGLDCDTGLPLGDACVKADLTVTFVAEKLGFANPLSKRYTGEVVVGDIGCPREIIDRVLREVPARGEERSE